VNQLVLEKKIGELISEFNNEIIKEELFNGAENEPYELDLNLKTDMEAFLEIISYPVIRALLEDCNHNQIKEALNNLVNRILQLSYKRQVQEIEHFINSELTYSDKEVYDIV
jgi:hypothetical protein